MDFVLAWIWLCLAFANVLIAEARGRSAALAFFVSLIASPFVVWCYLIAVPIRQRP